MLRLGLQKFLFLFFILRRNRWTKAWVKLPKKIWFIYRRVRSGPLGCCCGTEPKPWTCFFWGLWACPCGAMRKSKSPMESKSSAPNKLSQQTTSQPNTTTSTKLSKHTNIIGRLYKTPIHPTTEYPNPSDFDQPLSLI